MKAGIEKGFGALAVAVLLAAFALSVTGPWGPLNNLRYPLMAAAVFYILASLPGRKPWQGERLERMLSHSLFPWVTTFLAAVVFVRIKFLQWQAGEISGVDFSHIDYAIWSTAQGRFMEIPIIPPQSTFTDFFGNHYSPILFLPVLARWIVDSPFSSLVVHALSLAAAVPVLNALARKLVDRVTAALLTLTYVFCGVVASTLQFDIHQESFYPLAFGILFLGLYSRSLFLWLGAILALSVKEDAGVYLFPAFLLLAYLYPGKRMHCLLLAILSGAYTVLVLKVLMPLHQPAAASAPYYLPMWADYGKSFSEVALTMLTHPHWVFWDVVSNKALYKNLLPWGFLPFFTPLGLLALPPVVVSSTALGVQKGFGLYYGIVLVPLFFFAATRVLGRIRHRRRVAAGMLLLSAFVGGSFLKFPSASPHLSRIEEAAARLAVESGRIHVQSGLLPFLPYRDQWTRIDSMEQIPLAGRVKVALFEGISQGSLPGSLPELEEALSRRGYRLREARGNLRIYE